MFAWAENFRRCVTFSHATAIGPMAATYCCCVLGGEGRLDGAGNGRRMREFAGGEAEGEQQEGATAAQDVQFHTGSERGGGGFVELVRASEGK